MKFSQPKGFQPLTITLETAEEVYGLLVISQYFMTADAAKSRPFEFRQATLIEAKTRCHYNENPKD
jgi:hypothetical protein